MSEPDPIRSQRYRVFAAEPSERLRTRMTIELAGIVPVPVSSVDALAHELPEAGPAVLLLGPGYATEAGLEEVARITRAYAEVGVVLLTDELTLALLQEALRAGVRDAVTIDSGERQIRQAIERVGDAVVALAHRTAAAATAAAEPARRSRVVASFSTKGGVGKSVISTNVAVGLATRCPGRVVLVDADLQFGDVAVMLGVPPVNTIVDAARAIDTADTELLDRLLASHEASGLRVLCAPIEPASADLMTPLAMIEIVRLLRRMFDYVVVDMPPHFDDVVLALLEEADDVLLVASMDIPSIKNLKVGIQTLDLLSVAGSKLRLVLNRANAKVNLDVADVERALGVPAEFRIPSDISVPQAVNRGLPVVLDRPRSAAALALRRLVETVLATADPKPEADADPRRRGWRRSD